MSKEKKSQKDFIKYLSAIRQMAAQEGFSSLDETYVEHLRARFFGEAVIIGEARRVILREMKESDLEALYEFEGASLETILEVFLRESYEASKSYLQDYIDHMYPMYDYGIWAVELKKTGEMIGLCGLGQTEIDGQICTDLGYYICPKCRNQGFATECIEIVLDYAKNYLEFPHVYAIIKEENRISARILRKFGFQSIKKCESDLIFRKELAE